MSSTNMDSYTVHALASAGWLALQSTPLLLTPKLIMSMLITEPRHITPAETYLCRSLGLTLLALAALELILSGLIPLGSMGKAAAAESRDAVATSAGADRGPFGKAAVNISIVYSGLTAFYLYTQLTGASVAGVGSSFAFTAGLIGNTIMFCLGIWTALFANEAGHTSKSTGADKRTGNYPFENKESAKEKKRDVREKEGKSSRKSILKRL